MLYILKACPSAFLSFSPSGSRGWYKVLLQLEFLELKDFQKWNLYKESIEVLSFLWILKTFQCIWNCMGRAECSFPLWWFCPGKKALSCSFLKNGCLISGRVSEHLYIQTSPVSFSPHFQASVQFLLQKFQACIFSPYFRSLCNAVLCLLQLFTIYLCSLSQFIPSSLLFFYFILIWSFLLGWFLCILIALRRAVCLVETAAETLVLTGEAGWRQWIGAGHALALHVAHWSFAYGQS